MHGAGHHSRVEALAFECFAVAQVIIDAGRRGGPSLACNRCNFLLALRINEDQSLAADAVKVLLHGAADQQCGHARIECVTALLQDLECRRRGQRMTGGNPRISAHDRWSQRPLHRHGRRLCNACQPDRTGGQSGKHQENRQ